MGTSIMIGLPVTDTLWNFLEAIVELVNDYSQKLQTEAIANHVDPNRYKWECFPYPFYNLDLKEMLPLVSYIYTQIEISDNARFSANDLKYNFTLKMHCICRTDSTKGYTNSKNWALVYKHLLFTRYCLDILFYKEENFTLPEISRIQIENGLFSFKDTIDKKGNFENVSYLDITYNGSLNSNIPPDNPGYPLKNISYKLQPQEKE